MIDLSILICSTHTRAETFGRAIQQQVWDQYDALPVQYQQRLEIQMLVDNKKMMLGHKRNVMIDCAQGRYVLFIDDDDRIEPDMFATLLDAIEQHDVDVITFLVSVSLNGEAPRVCRYSKDYAQDRNTAIGYERLPNHICCVRRELAAKVSFPNLAHGEDSGYSKLLRQHLVSEHVIERVLYHYDYNVQTTEAQEHLRAPIRLRRQPPVVDVVMLSNATSPQLQQMTQHAIDTCLAGANSLPVQVTVLEQAGAMYQRATTIDMRDQGEFHYNRFANYGAQRGSANWIMVANNDLVFYDGWLHHLLAANNPVVSPKCPVDRRQTHVTENTAGWTNGVHFSGWCFMIQRSLWEQIGGFETSVSFWCSDDVVIEQLRPTGTMPMLVPEAKVRHLGSKTLELAPDPDALTWQQVDVFNRKYGRTKFADNLQYSEYRRNRAVT